MTQHAVSLRAFGLAIHDKKILRSLDMDVPNTGVTVILGPSGTGKSTLLRTLAGLNDHNRAVTCWGEAYYNGHLLDGQTSRPALVVQKVTHVISNVLDSLQSNLPNRSTLTRAEQIVVLQQHCQTLNQMWLLEQLATPVLHLNLYQQRILSIVRQMLTQPSLLMIDEPTVGLSDTEAAQMCGFIQRLSQHTPIVLVSHNLAQCRQLADWVILIASGRVQESGRAEQFFTAPISESAQIYLRTGSCPEQSEHDDEAAPLLSVAPASIAEPAIESSVESSTKPSAGTPTATPTTAFIAQPQMETQPALHALPAVVEARLVAKSHFMGPRGFVWLINGRIAGTPWPGILCDVADDLTDLQAVGVTQLLSLTENAFPAEIAAQFGMGVLHVPIVDMCAPTVEQAHACCLRIDQSMMAGHTIAVHCKAGLGRTGTILAAYWLWTQHSRGTAEQAIRHIRSLNAQMIQSEAQTDFLREFSSYLAMMLAS